MSSETNYPLALKPGTILAGQYIIENVLGQGGFGITYKAKDHKSDSFVALKEFFPDTLAYREESSVISYPGERSENFQYGKERFLDEAKTLAQFIGNSNIVRIHSYFEENGTAYFAMDYIEGISFDVYLKEHGGRISVAEAEQILFPVMDALGAVHSKGIIHRDVTPDNIYICSDGTVKLLDFGAARYSLGDKSRSLDVILKHGFAPKEQYTRRGRQGPYTDIYSLAATFYFAITGKRPPDSVDRLEEDSLIEPSSLGVDITVQKEEALFKALEVSPQYRYQSMEEFKAAMLGGAAQPAPAPVQVIPAQAPAPDSAVGRTVADSAPSAGSVPQTPAMAAVTKIGSGKKGKIIAAVAAGVAVVGVGVGVLVSNLGKGEIQVDDTPAAVTEQTGSGWEASTTPVTTSSPAATTRATTTTKTTTKATTTTTAPAEVPRSTGDATVPVPANNIHTRGIQCGSYWIRANNTLCYNGEDVDQFDKPISYLQEDRGGKCWFLYNGRIFLYFPEDKKSYYSVLFKDFDNVEAFYITKDYAFIYDSKILYRVTWEGAVEEKLEGIKYASDFMVSDGYVIYIKESSKNEGVDGIYKCTATSFNEWSGVSNPEYSINSFNCVDNKYYYSYIDNGTVCIMLKVGDLTAEAETHRCAVGEKLDDSIIGISQINAYNDWVFFSACFEQDSGMTWKIYKFQVDEEKKTWSYPEYVADGWDISLIPRSAGGFAINFLNDDGDTKEIKYDSSGNVVTNS